MPLKYKLDNGMTVLLIEDNKTPVITAQVWVKTGSVNEKKGEEGLSHFIEHLVFKGTDEYQVGEIAKVVEESGGELNAYTSFDQTVFYVNISNQYTNVALNTLSQMMGFPTFDKTEIDNERGVVIEEIKRSNDNPGRCASRLLFENVLEKTPYAIPVIGYEKIIEKVTPKKIRQYFDSYYVPQKMTLVIAGDISVSEIKKTIKNLFGKFKRRQPRAPFKVKKLAKPKAKLRIEKGPFEENQFFIAWKTPGVKSKDLPALDMAAMLLGAGDTSPLVRRLRLEKPLVQGVGSSVYAPEHMGLWAISLSLQLENLQETLQIIKEEFLRFASTPVSLSEIEKIRTQNESDTIYGMETVEGLARRFGEAQFYHDDYKAYNQYLNDLFKVSPADIIRVVKKYLDPQSVRISGLVKEDAKKVEERFATFVKELQKEWKALPKKKMVAKVKTRKPMSVKLATRDPSTIEEIKLSTGARLLYRKNSQLPLFSLKCAFRGGARAETIAGTQELTSRIWMSRTEKRDEQEIQEFLESKAASVSAFAGRNTSGLSAFAMSRDTEAVLDLFTEALVEPKFSEQYLDRERTILLEGLRQAQDKPNYWMNQLFQQAMFKGHPYAKDQTGTLESLPKVTIEEMKAVQKKVAHPSNLVFVMTGDVNPELFAKKFEVATKKMDQGQYIEGKFEADKIETSQELYKSMDKEQTHIIYGFRGLDIFDQRRYSLQVLQAILAGMGGRLFFELREKASLAYTVAPVKFDGLELGYFGSYIGCSPGKAKTAIRMMKEEFMKLVDKPVSDAELARAKQFLIGRHDLDLQRMSAVTSSILFNEIYGLDADELFKYHAHISQVTVQDVQMLAEALFKQKSITVAVGKTNPFK